MVNTGTAFEIEVKEFIESSIPDEYGIDRKLVKIRHKAPYYSRDREKDIVTDVSVEFYRKDASQYHMLWVIECKDTGRKVSVDDVEEFESKLKQIKGHKGTIASRKGFASGCLKFAKNKGIGLMILLDPTRVIRLVESLDESTIEEAFEDTDGKNLDQDFYGASSSGRDTVLMEVFVKEEIAELVRRSSKSKS
jgi:hypothetical protein